MTSHDLEQDFPTETHPLPPFAPPNATLLMLGSFPPPRHRWKMDFYYPNFQNDMWRIFGLVFFDDKNHFVDSQNQTFDETKIRHFLTQKGIAISDTAHTVKRLQGNALDKHLHIIERLDLASLLGDLPHCHTIMTTGELATNTLVSLLDKITQDTKTKTPMIGQPTTTVFFNRKITLYRLPSSSRAYPLALVKKAEQYQDFFQQIGLV